jgi:hypothetical protein
MADRPMIAMCMRGAESCLRTIKAFVKFALAAVVGPTFTVSQKSVTVTGQSRAT